MGNSEITALNRFLPEDSTGISPELSLFLRVAIRDVGALGPQFSKEYNRLLALEGRLEKGPFQLAVLGPAGSVKSTVINAFLGETCLPASVDSSLGIPVFFRYGPEPLARIWSHEETPLDEFSGKSAAEFLDLLCELAQEHDHFKNDSAVLHIEILHPAPILRQGIVLVHAPVINPDSMSRREMSVDMLAECDAILFVVSTHTPPTEIDVNVLHEIQTIGIPIFFILNKVDELNRFEEESALEFLRKTIRADFTLSDHLPIFSISARRGLDAKLFGDWSLWNASGLQEVESHLTRFLLAGKATSLHESISQEVVDILQAILIQIRLSVLSLQLPVDSLRCQLHALEEELKDVERQRALAAAALGGDLGSTLHILEDEADTLRRTSRDHLNRVVEKHLCESDCPGNVEDMIQDALAEAIITFFNNALKDVSRHLNLRVSEALSSHQIDAERLANHVLQTAARLFSVPCPAPSSFAAFEMKRKPYWVLRKWVPVFPRIIPEHWLDRLVPASLRKKRLTKRLSMQIEALVSHNVENLRWALYQNVKNAFQQFASRLDERFHQVIVATRGTIEAACHIRRDYTDRIADHMARLTSGESGLASLCEEIQSWVTKHCSKSQSTAWSDVPSRQENRISGNVRE